MGKGDEWIDRIGFSQCTGNGRAQLLRSAPYHSLHGAHQLLGSTLAGVDGRRRGLVQMGLRRSPHLAAVVVDMATLAVADWPVAMTSTAAGREAGDHSAPYVGTTVLLRRKRT